MTHLDFVLWVAFWMWHSGMISHPDSSLLGAWKCFDVLVALIGGIVLWRSA